MTTSLLLNSVSFTATVAALVLIVTGKALRTAGVIAVIAGATLNWDFPARAVTTVTELVSTWCLAAAEAFTGLIAPFVGAGQTAEMNAWWRSVFVGMPWLLAAAALVLFVVRLIQKNEHDRFDAGVGFLVPAMVAALPPLAAARGESMIGSLVSLFAQMLRSLT